MVDMKAILLSALAISTLQASFSLGAYFDAENRWSTRMLGAVDVVLAATSSTRCSVILINDGRTSSSDIYTHVSQIRAPWGLGVFEEQISGSNTNTTHPQLTDLVQHARQMRRGAWCVTVIVVSDAEDFLTEFARQSLQGRLLVWRTRLLVVTPIALIKMRELFSTWYTFSDMNTIVIAERKLKARFKYDIFSHLPYGPDGASFLKIATWTPERGLSMVSQTPFYPEKFNNFHGAQVTVAATTYKPLWVEERWKTSQGEMKIRLFGMDYFLLESIAYNLNFTFKVIPVTFWSEALELTATRQIFATPAYHYILDQRLKRYDFTTGFTSSYIAFCMANPQLEVNWLNLYYPLKDEVWASVVGVLLILSIALHEIQSYSVMRSREKENQGRTTRTLLAILLSQSVLQRHVPSSHSGRVLVAVWLVISLIIGSAYRGSLIASLTLPKYPHRAETIEELVNAVDKVTMMAWGSTFVEFFGKSDYPLFRKLSGLIKPGGSKIDGLNGALTKSKMAGQRYTRSTSVADRAVMVWMWERGTPPTVIARDINTSLTTVYRWIKRWRQDGSVRNKQRKIRLKKKSVINGILRKTEKKRKFSHENSRRLMNQTTCRGGSLHYEENISRAFQPQDQHPTSQLQSTVDPCRYSNESWLIHNSTDSFRYTAPKTFLASPSWVCQSDSLSYDLSINTPGYM